MPNFMAFVFTETLVTNVLKKHGVENTEGGKSLARQLSLFAALLSRKGGISNAVYPAFIAQSVAENRADDFRPKAAELVQYLDARTFRKPEEAVLALKKRGFKVEKKGNTATLKSQTPPFKTGRFLRRGTKVVLEYESTPAGGTTTGGTAAGSIT
jgi:hypothetical protein